MLPKAFDVLHAWREKFKKKTAASSVV